MKSCRNYMRSKQVVVLDNYRTREELKLVQVYFNRTDMESPYQDGGIKMQYILRKLRFCKEVSDKIKLKLTRSAFRRY